jgi:inosose dehydratase
MDNDRVLREMRGAGLTATENGPEGFLPADPASLAAVLAGHDLTSVGGFAPVLLHEESHDPVPTIASLLDGFVAANADVIVLAASTGQEGYDARPTLTADQWTVLLRNLDRLAAASAERGILAVVHPHVGTMIEQRDEVHRVLDGSSIPLCLDTGHLMIGGTDPAELATAAADRIAHAHLKDVDAALAARVQAGELTYTDAVRAGMYTPLGTGDVGIGGVVDSLLDAGYTGWFVLEQDTILSEEPGEVGGPVTDVVASVQHLHDIVAARTAAV